MSSHGKSRFVLMFLASAAIFSLVAFRAASAQAQQYEGNAAPPPAAPPPYYPPEQVPAGAEPAVAQQGDAPYPAQAPEGWDSPPDSGDQANGGAPLIPPNVEGPAYPASNGGYCYVGPHPVDTRVVPGESWDNTPGQHMRPYPPIDTRLFSYREGCYYFTGDPRDFGYGGQTYAYYGAHPILDGYGGGWCFMMGPHTHVWAPWSPSFTVVGSWYYWHGPFDPFFWAYWPYYSLYYRSYYPSYYGGGRFYRGGGWRVAPAIRPVQVQAWRGSNYLRGAPVYRGAPPASSVRGVAPGANAYRGNMSPGVQPGFHAQQPGYSRPVTPTYRTGAPAYNGSPGFRAPSPAPSRPSFSPAPATRSFSAPSGGFRGGGGGRHR